MKAGALSVFLSAASPVLLCLAHERHLVGSTAGTGCHKTQLVAAYLGIQCQKVGETWPWEAGFRAPVPKIVGKEEFKSQRN